MGNHRCVCRSEFCKRDGGAGSVRMPTDKEKWQSWAECLWGEGHGRLPHGDQRISLAHFPSGSVKANATSSLPDGSDVGVHVVDGALPDQSDEAMLRESKGSLGRLLKSDAVRRRHQQELLAAHGKVVDAKAHIKLLQAENRGLRQELKEAKEEKEEAVAEATSKVKGINHTILKDKTEKQSKSLVGLASHDGLVVSVNIVATKCLRRRTRRWTLLWLWLALSV